LLHVQPPLLAWIVTALDVVKHIKWRETGAFYVFSVCVIRI